MAGTVVTFYSFKGGVGRSFALANIAVLLARWGHRVLVIDWDLEAPGLHHYFGDLTSPPLAGVIDLVDDFTADQLWPVSEYATKVNLNELGSVDLIAAGRQDARYAARVQDVDWAGLYERGFADYLEDRRAEWSANYDYVLIDSRTGISDIAGICTAQLPDHLVVVFTANEQSLRGAVDIAGRANVARDRMPYDRGQLTVLPVLSRLDSRVEYKQAEQWYQRCTELTAPLFRNWLVQNVSEAQMLRHLTIPYVSYWTFGERLSVVDEPSPSTDQISYALETVAAVIMHQFERTDLLSDNRDAYVAAAKTPRRPFTVDVRVSAPRSLKVRASELVIELRRLGLNAERSLSGAPELLNESPGSGRHLCLLIDGQASRWQVAEAEQFMRHALAGDGDRRLFPVLTRTAEPGQLPGFLRHLQFRQLGPRTSIRDVARWIRGQMDNEKTEHRIYRDATLVVRQLPELLNRPRWELVEQTVLAMVDALRGNDIDSLVELTADLELAGRMRLAAGDLISAPETVRTIIAHLLDTLDSH